MDKKKISGVTVNFKNSESKIFSEIDGTLSVFKNARKKGGYSNSQEWTEYHITWIEYDKPLSVDSPTEVDPEHRQEEAWCGIHKMSPGDCFKLHNPTAFSGRAATYTASELSILEENRVRKAKHPPILEEFDITDLLQGYGNGSIRSNGT